jgi:hypothetical protein
MYKTVNGFSNLYWGWGGEDDDLSLRLIQRRMCIVRPNYEFAVYVGRKSIIDFLFLKFCFHCLALPHPHGQRNDARFDLLTWATVRLDTDGYAQIDSMTRIVDIRKTSTVTHLKLDVDVDQSLYKPPSMKKFQSLLNKTYDHVATTRKTVESIATQTAGTILKTS